MARLGATQIVSFPRVSPSAEGLAASRATESLESLRARCKAAETAANAAIAEASRTRAELLRVRRVCQEMLDSTALELLELKRQLQSRRTAVQPEAHTIDDIPFDEIEAILAASPLCSDIPITE